MSDASIGTARRVRPDASILVASDAQANANVVAELLAEEFNGVRSSWRPESAVADFEENPPQVLVLAFEDFEKAEVYYLGLYRHSRAIYGQAHRTIVLCHKDDVRRAFDLCRTEHFDDYVLFWPMSYDGFRVPMAIYNALRHLAAAQGVARYPREMVDGAQRLGAMGDFIDERLAAGAQRVEAIRATADRIEKGFDSALDQLPGRLQAGGATDARSIEAVRGEIRRMQREDVGPGFQALTDAVAPAGRWIDDLRAGAAPYVDAAKSMQSLARVRRVLVVDDDPFQRRLLAKFLSAEPYEVMFAEDSSEAFAMAMADRPDLILMDVMLPDVDGIEATRRIRAHPDLAKIPVIMLTGKSGRDTVIESRRAGATDFMVKPVDRKVLIAKLREMLGDTALKTE
jgi:PleD family two-component response regulator